MNNVCKVSVQIIVLIPLLKVYTHISKIVTTTVISKGTPQASKMAICNTLATKYSLKDAPITLLIKKKIAPVL